MKRHLERILTTCLICVFAIGCGNSQAEDVNTNQSARADIPPAGAGDVPALVRRSAETSASDGAKTSVRGAKRPDAAGVKVDIDLTKMNSTMIYAQVQNMMMKPKDYLGKTVRASGAYNVWCFTGTDECHHFVAIADAAACCQTGLEFQWKGARSKDFPRELTLIEVVGVFSGYEKFERTLYYLEVDGITVLKK